jgi:RHS repeat-associated protein
VTQASSVLGDDELLAQTRSGAVSYDLSDGQGNVRLLTDGNGAVTDRYTYDAYGNLLTSQGATVNPYRYTGQPLDSLTGLYDLRARYYDPTSGRFLSRDTAGIDVSNPVELDRYIYTHDDPINLTDPSGHGPVLEQGLLIALFTASIASVPLLFFGDYLIYVVEAITDISNAVIVPALRRLWETLISIGRSFLPHPEPAPQPAPGPQPPAPLPPPEPAEPNWVVRGGTAAPDNLQKGYGPHDQVPGLYGFSVQYQPGKTLDQLAQAGQFKNKQISYQTDLILIGAAVALGYGALLVPSPGPGYHADFEVLQNGVVLQQLPTDLADALSAAFIRKPNPFPVP